MTTTDTSNHDKLRHALLRLHKALLDAQRIRYERDNGRVESRGELLDLVLQDASFEWLRVLSALIARLDELAEVDDKDVSGGCASRETAGSPALTGKSSKPCPTRWSRTCSSRACCRITQPRRGERAGPDLEESGEKYESGAWSTPPCGMIHRAIGYRSDSPAPS